MKKKSVMIVLLSLVLLNSILISAIGVGSPYSKDLPLEMYAGQEKTVILSLQNYDIDAEITLEGEISSGSEVASLEQTKHTVGFESKVQVEMTVKVPSSAQIGDSYEIVYSFTQSEGEEGEGMVAMNQKIERRFKVNIIEKPAEPETTEPSDQGLGIGWWIAIIVIVIIVLAVIYIVMKGRKGQLAAEGRVPTNAPVKGKMVKPMK